MARWAEKLTWHASRCCWKKRLRGRTYYLDPRPVRRADKVAHDLALANWEQLLAELEREQDSDRLDELKSQYSELHANVQRVRRLMAQAPEEHSGEAFMLHLQVLQSQVWDHPDFQIAAWAPSDTIDKLIDAFLSHYRVQVSINARSAGRYAAIRRDLDRFAAWIPGGEEAAMGGRPVAGLNAQALTGYHGHLASEMASGSISPNFAHDQLGSVKNMVRWAWENEKIVSLPRNLRSRALTIKIPPKAIQTASIEDVLAVFNAAPLRTKLFLLLMTNAGFTQKDIADLKPDEIDWTRGMITRRRSKTGGYGSVPTVQYLLWPVTFELLKQFGSRQGERAFLSTSDRPLLWESVQPDGRVRKVDAIRLAFNRVRHDLNQEHRDATGTNDTRISFSLKQLRSCSASLLQGHDRFREIVGFFLGHAPSTIAERHYAAPSQPLLDDALMWLESQYKFPNPLDGSTNEGPTT